MGLPAVELPYRYASLNGVGETTLQSHAGTSQFLLFDSSPATNGGIRVDSPALGVPNNYFLFRDPSGKCLSVEVSGQLPATTLKGLFLGQAATSHCAIKIDKGPMFHIQGVGLVAMLGATGGPFAGRWVFAVSIF